MTSATIAEVLGGKKILGRSIKTFAELAELIRRGLPSGSLLVLGERLDLKNAALSEKLGIPQRTLTRRLSRHSRLTAAESDRTVRLARVHATAVEMIGNASKAAEWLRTANRALGGEAPIDQPDTDLGTKEVEEILGRIAYGVHS
jgi:putative toxin-antitoxin system antitoxin component (TIGR02293 family)